MNYKKLFVACFILIVVVFIYVFFYKGTCNICNKTSVATEKYEEKIFATNKNNLIAVVDLRKIVLESDAGKGIEKQIAEINEASKKELQEVESKMKSMERDKLSETDSQKVMDMQVALYEMVKKRRNQISEAYKNAVLELENAVNDVLKQVAEQGDIPLIINLEAVAYVNSHCRDVTNEVIQKINDTHPYIKVKIK